MGWVKHRGRVVWAAAIFLLSSAVYASTASWSWAQAIDQDVFSSILTAHRIGTTGSPFLDSSYQEMTREPFYGNLAWLVETERGVVSKYPPGAALLGAPFYAVVRNAPVMDLRDPRVGGQEVRIAVPRVWVSTLVAVLTTALAVALLALSLGTLTTPSLAFAAALVAAFGTSAWSNASDQLWQHGPAMMWLAAAMWMLGRDRWGWAGVLLGAAVLTRPHTILFGVGLCAVATWELRRAFVPRVAALLPGLLAGAVFLILFNQIAFGQTSVLGGYAPELEDRFRSATAGWYLRSYLGSLFDVRTGLLPWAPFLVLAAVGLSEGWRSSPVWVRGLAVGSAMYVLVQFGMDSHRPGQVIPYRYHLEALWAAFPLVVLSARAWAGETMGRWRMLAYASAVSVCLQGTAAIKNSQTSLPDCCSVAEETAVR
jgi:hypothetical protein